MSGLLEGTTPGPWSVEDGKWVKEYAEGPTGWFVCHPGTECDATAICWVEKEQDARLIAAAPDLAKEVEVLKDWLQYAINIIDKGNLYEVQCCDGHMCGCQASTYADEFLHYARTLLPLGKGEGL